MSHTACFDKAGHALDLINRLYEMRTEERHCDFVIKVGSERIPAHRNVLTAMSEYFDRMLFHNTIENISGIADMKNVDPDCVRICVDFIYGRVVEVPEDKYEDLMNVAKLMQLNKLAKIVENIIGRNLNAKLFFIAKRIADMYGYELLMNKCKEFGNEHFVSISMEDEFGDLDKSFVTEIIKSGCVRMTETEKLKAALTWVKHDVEARWKDLPHFIKCVDLRFVPLEWRQQLLENDSLIKDSVTCLRILTSSIIKSLLKEVKRKSIQEKAILVFDGNSGHLEQFKPRSNSWSRMHQMNDVMKMCGFSVLLYNDYIYVFMQNKKVFRLKYTEQAAMWEQMAEMIKGHGYSPPVVVVGGLFYAVGGDDDCPTKCIERFDPEDNKWSRLQDKPRDTRSSALLVMRGCVYSFAGYQKNVEWMNNVQRFDPTTSEWKEMKPMREAKVSVAAVELKNKAYVMGGYNEDSLASVDCYDPEMDQWTTLAPMNFPRLFFRAFSIDGSIYAVGGNNGFPYNIDKYDVQKNEWTLVPMPSGMELQILNSVDIKLDK